ncbi:hypothetical protein Dtox_1875 [Desulfofarcimen acetoxidans DSM 771]|uniref:PD-(D/E)XK endonuclease-like domain-containing protein n=1 Tax=Desulfofarcimen acetoxidans (strain ATCC 49208 / DSM 771 / KCTC 5769 / VKM B-1644 / 5575) TaxID=485916 RepID=C8VXR5_DESAS|nr:hypothetical protein [Desulfofarcimen acetoxidans]ACV62721.1 hypothetical protein Dtox_1875 [Desulfofarcimen acetoxidans DSM 771]
MTLFNRAGARQLREEVVESHIDNKLADAILEHFNEIHSMELPVDFEIERSLLKDELDSINRKSQFFFTNEMITFSPSSASKCERELLFKAISTTKDNNSFFPYQRRWMRNGTAVHAAVQKDLLYAEKYLDNPKFTVERTVEGKPAWERNIKKSKQFNHNGVSFLIYGMMDGILIHTPTATRLGFEFKTKSTTISAVGSYKLKGPQSSHIEQCVAYSLLFDIDEFLIVYESLAKDGWNKGEAAKPDMRAFHVTVTDNDREALLDKLAAVAQDFYLDQMPEGNFSKCIFCTYKESCDLARAS